MGEVRLQRVRRIHCRVESLAPLDHGDRARWNVHNHQPLLRDRVERGVDAGQQMVRVAD